MNKQQSGRLGESQAAILLQRQGYRLIEQNYRSGRWGEIDLICIESDDLVFVEVKTRTGQQYGSPVEAVSWGKRQRLLRAAQQYKLTHPDTPDSMRFDVVAITISANGQMQHSELYKNIDHG